METVFLAQVIGVYMLVGSLSGLLYPARMQKAMAEFSKSYILPVFDGALALIVGLLIVLTHNVWEGLAATLITLVGWIAVIEGLAMFLLPQETMMRFAERLGSKSATSAFCVIGVIIGGYLVYYGFVVM